MERNFVLGALIPRLTRVSTTYSSSLSFAGCTQLYGVETLTKRNRASQSTFPPIDGQTSDLWYSFSPTPRQTKPAQKYPQDPRCTSFHKSDSRFLELGSKGGLKWDAVNDLRNRNVQDITHYGLFQANGRWKRCVLWSDSSRSRLPGGMLTVRSGPSMPMVDHSNLVSLTDLDGRAFLHRGTAAGSSPMRLGRGIAVIAQIEI